MASKKVIRGRQATLPRRSDYAKAFLKDWQGLQHRGINLASLREVMVLLIDNEVPLSAEWKDHPLKGEWRDHRECHAGGDLLLIYRLTNGDKDITFVRAGTHAELFE